MERKDFIERIIVKTIVRENFTSIISVYGPYESSSSQAEAKEKFLRRLQEACEDIGYKVYLLEDINARKGNKSK